MENVGLKEDVLDGTKCKNDILKPFRRLQMMGKLREEDETIVTDILACFHRHRVPRRLRL